jgi:hypothetical protein
MSIVFFCQSCGARFEVPATSAGKKGRCKHCNQMMTIPKMHELASMVAMPAIAPAAVGAGPKVATAARPAAREAGAGDSLGWLATANSNVGLAPLTVDNLPTIDRARKPIKPKYDEDLGDGLPYQIGQPLVKAAGGRSSGRPASGLKMAWRKDLGFVQKLFRKINEAAYLISVPFLLMILLGAIIKNRPLALTGATAVVLLEIARIISGIANLAVVPFREGISQGIMFLIPPLTFFYLSNHWKQLKKPTMRIVGPIATIAAVLLAFTLVPTLHKDGKMGSLKDLETEAKELEGEFIDKVDKTKKLDAGGIVKEVGKSIGDAAGKINEIGQPDAAGKAP